MAARKGKIYHALNHPLRREIIMLLGSKGSLSSTELKRILNIGSGKLYYHLENLGGLIEQDEKKRYRLSKEGIRAYALLLSEEATPVRRMDRSGRRSGYSGKLLSLITPTSVILRLYEDPLRHLPLAVLPVLLGGWLSNVSGLQLILLFYVNQPQALPVTLIQFLASWLTIYIISEGLSRGLFRRSGGSIELLLGSALSLTPLILYSLIWLLNWHLKLGMEGLFGGWILRGLLLLAQGWSLTILTLAISYAKTITVDKASLISFIIAYVGIALYILSIKI